MNEQIEVFIDYQEEGKPNRDLIIEIEAHFDADEIEPGWEYQVIDVIDEDNKSIPFESLDQWTQDEIHHHIDSYLAGEDPEEHRGL